MNKRRAIGFLALFVIATVIVGFGSFFNKGSFYVKATENPSQPTIQRSVPTDPDLSCARGLNVTANQFGVLTLTWNEVKPRRGGSITYQVEYKINKPIAEGGTAGIWVGGQEGGEISKTSQTINHGFDPEVFYRVIVFETTKDGKKYRCNASNAEAIQGREGGVLPPINLPGGSSGAAPVPVTPGYGTPAVLQKTNEMDIPTATRHLKTVSTVLQRGITQKKFTKDEIKQVEEIQQIITELLKLSDEYNDLNQQFNQTKDENKKIKIKQDLDILVENFLSKLENELKPKLMGLNLYNKDIFLEGEEGDKEKQAFSALINFKTPEVAESSCSVLYCNQGWGGLLPWNWLKKAICELGCLLVEIANSFLKASLNFFKSASEMVLLQQKPFFVIVTHAQSPQTSQLNLPLTPPGGRAQMSLSSRLQHEKIVAGWKYSLEITDVVVVFAILFIAFAHILKLNLDTYAVKKSLPWLVIGFILAHFSLLICKILTDFASLLHVFFLKTGVEQGSLIQALEGLMINDLLKTVGGIPGGFLLIFGLSGILGCLPLIVAFFILFFPALLLLALGFLLYARTFVILILVMVAPIAFVCLGFPPFQRYFGTWWSWFLKWTFLSPVVGFLIGLAARLGNATKGEFGDFFSWLIGIIVLGLSLIVPFKMGGAIMATWGRLGQMITGTGRGGYLRKPLEEFIGTKLASAKTKIKTGEIPVGPTMPQWSIKGKKIFGPFAGKTMLGFLGDLVDKNEGVRKWMRKKIQTPSLWLSTWQLKGEVEKMAAQKREETILYNAFGGLFRDVQRKENEGEKLSVEDSRVQKLALSYFKDESSTYEFTPVKVLLEQLTAVDEKGRSLIEKYLTGELSGPEMIDVGAKIYALFVKQYSRNPQERTAAAEAFQALAQRTTGNFNSQIESIPPNRWTTSRLLEAPARNPELERQLLVEKAVQLNNAIPQDSPLKNIQNRDQNSQNLQKLISAIHQLIQTTGEKIKEDPSIANQLTNLQIPHLIDIKNQANKLENPDQRKRVYHDLETKLKLLYDINITENPNNLDQLRQTVLSMGITEEALKRIADILPKQPGQMDEQQKATVSLQIQNVLSRVIPDLAESVNVKLEQSDIEQIKRNLAEEIIQEYKNQEDLNSFLNNLRTDIQTINKQREKFIDQIKSRGKS